MLKILLEILSNFFIFQLSHYTCVMLQDKQNFLQ